MDCEASLDQQAIAPRDREEYDNWRCTIFTHLTDRGSKAFLKYLENLGDGSCQYMYSYEFWCRCDEMELTDIYDTYISDSSEKQVCGIKPSMIRDFCKGKETKAIRELKESMKPHLDEKFTDFKKYLEEKYGHLYNR
ncbi:uncharacterized protein LOC143033896 isoform X2 [Oratosquilla oratoria]|uniref:uncharacterized protein LOC143033896 isoform X2 n=1 Tax=Oratosquilla oratoria TaxID=337810 RepID=UPI003F764744